MARRNSKGQFVKGGSKARRSSGRRRVAADEQITLVNVAAPKAAPRRRRSGGGHVVKHVSRRRRATSHSGGGSLGGLTKLIGGGHRAPILVGAAALGYANQQGWLAKLPVLGKAGPITSASLLGWAAEELLKVKLPSIVRDMVTAGLSISAFNIGNTIGTPGGTTLVGDQVYPGGAAFYE